MECYFCKWLITCQFKAPATSIKKNTHFPMGRFFTYSMVGLRGWSAELENQKVIKNKKTTMKSITYYARKLYISTTDGACSRMDVMLLSGLSVTLSLPTKKPAARVLSQSLQLINICNTLYSNQKHPCIWYKTLWHCSDKLSCNFQAHNTFMNH